MRYHVLLLDPDRPYPRYFSQLEAPDDAEAQRFVAVTWPGERQRIVRQDGDLLWWLSDRT